MRLLALALFITTGFSAFAAPLAAAPSGVAFGSDISVFDHSGGCRKDSPPGQCCHAGSQPLHCH